MNNQSETSTDETPPGPSVAPHPLSKRQIKAAALSNERLGKERWKSLLPDARALWSKVPAEDLARVNGNVHALAGLVQLRYRTDREEADRQVQQFFQDHPPITETLR